MTTSNEEMEARKAHVAKLQQDMRAAGLLPVVGVVVEGPYKEIVESRSLTR